MKEEETSPSNTKTDDSWDAAARTTTKRICAILAFQVDERIPENPLSQQLPRAIPFFDAFAPINPKSSWKDGGMPWKECKQGDHDDSPRVSSLAFRWMFLVDDLSFSGDISSSGTWKGVSGELIYL